VKRLHVIVAMFSLVACGTARSTGGEPPRSAPRPLPEPRAATAPTAPPLTVPPSPPEPTFGVVVEGPCYNLTAEVLENATLIHHGFVQSAYYYLKDISGARVPVPGRLVFGRVRDDGSIDGDPALERGIPLVSAAYAGGGAGTGTLDVQSLRGHWPDHVSLSLAGGGFRGIIDAFDFDWRGDHWAPRPPRTFGDEDRDVQAPWLAGSSLTMPHSWSPYPQFVVVPAGAAPTPDFSALHVPKEPDCTFVESAILTRPDGEIFLAGKFCGIYPTHDHPEWHYDGSHPPALQGESTIARWAPGSPAKAMTLPAVANHAELELDGFLEASPPSIYAFGTTGTSPEGGKAPYVAFYDGTIWSRVEVPFKGAVRERHVEPDGTLWVSNAAKELYARAPSGAWAKQPIEAVTTVAWQHDRPEWVVAGGAILHHGKGGEWTAIDAPHPAVSAGARYAQSRRHLEWGEELWLGAGAFIVRLGENGRWTRFDVPPPAFSPASHFAVDNIFFGQNRQVWIKASYEERRPEWPTPDKREALLLLGASRPATRCDADIGPSFSSWPPSATAACQTPVVILAHVSKSAPADFKFPQTRAAVRGHEEIAGAEFGETEIDGKRLLVARVPSLQKGSRLAELVSHAVAGTHPEVLCAEPTFTRTVSFDLGPPAVPPRSPGRAAPRP